MGLTRDLVARYASQWQAMSTHPFIAACASGEVEAEVFRRWLVQDYLYVQGLVGFVGLLTGRAPEPLQRPLGQAIIVLSDELDLFRRMAGELGAELDGAEAAPACYDYLQFLKAVAYEEPFLHGLTVYWALEKAYLDSWLNVSRSAAFKARSAEIPWSPFVVQWTKPEFSAYVSWLAGQVDELAASPAAGSRSTGESAPAASPDAARVGWLFLRTVQYEWRFWQLALSGEGWPLE